MTERHTEERDRTQFYFWIIGMLLVGVLHICNNPRTGVLCESLVAVKGGKCLTNSEGDDRETQIKIKYDIMRRLYGALQCRKP